MGIRGIFRIFWVFGRTLKENFSKNLTKLFYRHVAGMNSGSRAKVSLNLFMHKTSIFFGTIMRSFFMVISLACVFATRSVEAQSDSNSYLREEVLVTERAFAKTMADRNFDAFLAMVDEEAIFVQQNNSLRGRDQVGAAWKKWFKEKNAPFSWEPERVEVLESGTLAMSMGPVFDNEGKQVATFSSIWRRDKSGKWRIIFDKGNDICSCEPEKK
ncbi:YybH family protein [Undibacterium jejuense]|nr:nuclear transport factor 2 family protein [Undibacterium jejuense]